MYVSVCIPATRSDTVNATIKSIRGQTWKDWELIVIGQGNNTSIKSIVADVAKEDKRIRYLHIAQPGVSRARNAGINASLGDIVAMTDDDCEPKEDWLSLCVEAFRNNPNLGFVGGALVKPNVPTSALSVCPEVIPAEVLYDPRASHQHAPEGWDWCGANSCIDRRIAGQVGNFDEFLGPGAPDFPSGEDLDYKLRLEAMGVRMLTTPRLIVNHTYGYRHGFKAVLKHLSNYAVGLGGVAGKLTLSGDPRGKEWLKGNWRIYLGEWAHLQFKRVPQGIWRMLNFSRAYKLCLAKYQFHDGFLRPKVPVILK